MINGVGFFKLHRELFNKPIWLNSTPEQKTILITLLAMVNFKENDWEWKGKKFKTKAGQKITSVASIKKACGKGVSTQNIKTALKRFENLEFLTNESTNDGRLVTITNWELYQFNENNQPTKQPTLNQPLTNDSPTLNQPLTTKEEGKKVLEGEEGDKDKNKDNTLSATVTDKIPYTKIMDAWNTTCKDLPKLIKMTDKRKDKLKTRWNQYKEIDLFNEAIKKISESNFCNGQSDNGWKATFDWLIDNDTNMVKVLEGNYDNREITKKDKDYHLIDYDNQTESEYGGW